MNMEDNSSFLYTGKHINSNDLVKLPIDNEVVKRVE